MVKKKKLKIKKCFFQKYGVISDKKNYLCQSNTEAATDKKKKKRVVDLTLVRTECLQKNKN